MSPTPGARSKVRAAETGSLKFYVGYLVGAVRHLKHARTRPGKHPPAGHGHAVAIFNVLRIQRDVKRAEHAGLYFREQNIHCVKIISNATRFPKSAGEAELTLPL